MDGKQIHHAVHTFMSPLFGGDVEGGGVVAVKGFEVAHRHIGQGFGGLLQRLNNL